MSESRLFLPTMAELDEVTALIMPGPKFESLGPEAKLQILAATQAALHTSQLVDVDASLAKVGDWFEKSRLYYP